MQVIIVYVILHPNTLNSKYVIYYSETQQTGKLQCAKQPISVTNNIPHHLTHSAVDDNGYSYPQDVMIEPTIADGPSPYCIPVTEKYYVNFIQPADSLVLLFNQIKQTNVKEISRSSIQ